MGKRVIGRLLKNGEIHRKKGPRLWFVPRRDWSKVPLGKYCDRELAEKLNVPIYTVANARRYLGISGFRPSGRDCTLIREIVLEAIGRLPTSLRTIYDRVIEAYGEVSKRTVERHLAWYVHQGHLQRTKEGPSQEWTYLRLR